MKTRNKVMIGAVTLLFAAALVLVIVGVVTHEEPGFTVEDARWDHTPLTVTCTEYANESPEPEICGVVRDASETINSRLDFDMLIYLTGAEPGSDIVVVLNAPVEVGSDEPCGEPGECFQLRNSGGTYDRCDFQTMNVAGGGDLQRLVTYHGLGHCMGLAHDDYEQSIMRPVQRATPDRTIPPWISDYDRSILRERYRR